MQPQVHAGGSARAGTREKLSEAYRQTPYASVRGSDETGHTAGIQNPKLFEVRRRVRWSKHVRGLGARHCPRQRAVLRGEAGEPGDVEPGCWCG